MLGVQAEIATLYLVGFGSSALSAPFAGFVADKYGRRTGCMAYTLLQTVRWSRSRGTRSGIIGYQG
jgi:MFS family permease